ncbi:MAG TPA: hypothetical protein VI583_18635 [Cyclobacteriaceae bacterium]|nr:hypothetical protein [Cyclobacteriaceae bacterium]
MNSSPEKDDSRDKNITLSDTPPFLGSWTMIYAVVLACLFLMVILFYWFSISFK